MFAAAALLVMAAVPVPADDRQPPELDALRACADDRDQDCVDVLGGPAIERFPDDPGVHVVLAAEVLDRKRDVTSEAYDFIEYARVFGDSPNRLELVRLVWRIAAYRQRLRDELPSPSLIADRKALLAALDAFVPEDGAEEGRVVQLRMWVRLAGDEDVTADAMAAAPRMLELGDPTSIYPVARMLIEAAESDPAAARQQRELIDALLDADPSSARYPGYLVLDARAQPDRERAKASLHRLIRSGLPPDMEDDAWVLFAGMHKPRELPYDATFALGAILDERRLRNTTVNAARILASDMTARRARVMALTLLDEADRDFDLREPTLDLQRAALLSDLGRHIDALLLLQGSLLEGGTDYSRWFYAAREHQLLGNHPEAVRLNQFYLLQVSERASGASPFGPPVSLNASVEESVKVWYRIIEMHPGFFGRSGVRQFIEMLALLAAGLLAASHASRARAFLLPGVLAGEIVLFSGWIALRTIADGAPVPALSWVWLATASLRTFVLVCGGLYVSALARLPRHTQSIAGPALATCAAVIAGLAVGFVYPPLFVLEGMPGFARVAELGLGPERYAEVPAVFVSAMRVEAASRLVWPALVLTALPTRGLFAVPLVRAGSFALPTRETLAVVISALLCSAGSLAAFPLALAASAALVVARIHWGAIAPFVLHAAFLAGAVGAGVTAP